MDRPDRSPYLRIYNGSVSGSVSGSAGSAPAELRGKSGEDSRYLKHALGYRCLRTKQPH